MESRDPDHIVEITRILFEKQIKPAILSSIVETEAELFKDNLRKKLRPVIDKLTIECIEKVKKMQSFGDELYIKLDWRGTGEVC